MGVHTAMAPDMLYFAYHGFGAMVLIWNRGSFSNMDFTFACKVVE